MAKPPIVKPALAGLLLAAVEGAAVYYTVAGNTVGLPALPMAIGSAGVCVSVLGFYLSAIGRLQPPPSRRFQVVSLSLCSLTLVGLVHFGLVAGLGPSAGSPWPVAWVAAFLLSLNFIHLLWAAVTPWVLARSRPTT